MQDRLDTRTIAYFDAKLCRGGHIRDQAGHGRLQAGHEAVAQATLTGTLCTHRNVKDLINSVGGVQVLFFLIAQLDGLLETHRGRPDAPDPTLCTDTFLALVAEFLRSRVNVRHAMKTPVLPCLRALLHSSGAAVLTVHALEAVQALLELPSPRAEFLRAVLRHFVFDFALWARSSFAVRLGYLQIVDRAFLQSPAYCRQYYGIG